MKNIMPPINTPDNAFHDGNPVTGEQGTIVPGLWLNNIQGATRNTQEELISVLTEAGIEIDEGINNQLSLAILKLITDKTPALPAASLITKGIVQLSSSITSTSEVLAATPKAVRAVDIAALKIANNLSEIKDAGPTAVAQTLTNLGLTGIGIGLPAQTSIPNFDFQTFAFTSGANYLAVTTNWLNYPAGISYGNGTVSIIVDYVTATNRVGLTLILDTTSQTNYRVYKVFGVGAPGSRVFTVREFWNSANPIPISGGGLGATTVAGAIANLELGEGSLAPIGVPLPYPQATPPSGYLKCNGSSFSTTTYPRLALMYPSGVLPDLRGNVIRAWDDGRGIDPARALLTEQKGSYLLREWTANNVVSFYSGDGVGLEEDPIIGAIPALDAKLVTAGGTFRTSSNHLGIARMRNISFNYIVRAL